MNGMLLSLDKNRCVLLVLLDLSAAVDIVDHELLLQRFEIYNLELRTGFVHIFIYFTGDSKWSESKEWTLILQTCKLACHRFGAGPF